MTPFRPTSHDRPGEQISTTPSGLKVTSARRLIDLDLPVLCKSF